MSCILGFPLVKSHWVNVKQCSGGYWILIHTLVIVYLNGFPYVLRDYADPMQNMVTFQGISAGRLEKLEERLKADVVKEAKSMGGLLLVHQELCKLLVFKMKDGLD